jgi:histidine decarboxylase
VTITGSFTWGRAEGEEEDMHTMVDMEWKTLQAPALAYHPVKSGGDSERRFSPRDVLRSSIGPDDQYCVGYSGLGGYVLTLVLGIGVTEVKFAPLGSQILDSIVAYDRAEVDDVYIGQINMVTVSSFCGPQGVIWGYDVARNMLPSPPLLGEEELREIPDVEVISGERLRESARMLFGTRNKRHFPLLPGSHVSCACKYRTFPGPTLLYAAVGIGIPERRDRHACLLMEDVGECESIFYSLGLETARRQTALNMVQSVLRIGENHGISYEKVIVDVITKPVGLGEVGCALVAAPYIHLARNAYHPDLHDMTLQEWYGLRRKYFLDTYEDGEVYLPWRRTRGFCGERIR